MRIFSRIKFATRILVSGGIMLPFSAGFADSVFAKVKLPQNTIISTSSPAQIDLKDFFQVHPAPGPIISIEFSAPEADGYREVLVDPQGLLTENRLTYKTTDGIPYLNIYHAFTEEFIWNNYRVDFQLSPELAPINVANFLSYVAAGHYDRTIIHRTGGPSLGSREPSQEFLQGGAMRRVDPSFNQGMLQWIPLFPRVALEATGSHTEGTLAMARLDGNPQSATSQFFINTSDNSQSNDGNYSVIGNLVSDNLEVLRDLTKANTFDLRPLYRQEEIWNSFPLFTPYGDDPLSYITLDSFNVSEPIAFAETYEWKFVEVENGTTQQAQHLFSVSTSGDGTLSISSQESGSALLEVSATDNIGRTKSLVIPLFAISDQVVSTFGTNLNRRSNLTGIVDVFPGGHYEVDWLGYVVEEGYPYLHLEKLGRSIVYRINANSFMIYTDPVGWLWTNPNAYPWIYSVKFQTWFYLIDTGGQTQQRWVFCPEGVEGYLWFPLEWLP